MTTSGATVVDWLNLQNSLEKKYNLKSADKKGAFLVKEKALTLFKTIISALFATRASYLDIAFCSSADNTVIFLFMTSIFFSSP